MGFVDKLHKEDFSPSDYSTIRPILQVTKVHYKKRRYNQTYTRQYSLLAVDGDNQSVHLSINTSLNSRICIIEEGSMIRLDLYRQLFYSYSGNEKPQTVIVLVSNFTLFGRVPLNESSNEDEDAPLALTIDFQRPNTENSKENAGANHGINAGASRDTTLAWVDNGESPCDGRNCSKYGMHFTTCVTDCFPVPSLNLTNVVGECPFVTKELSQMPDSDKRFLCYYWYATNVYGYNGKGNVAELPPCLLNEVRKRFPTGPFVGHKNTRKRRAGQS